MSEVGDAIAEVREELADATPDFMPDLCDLLTTPADGNFGKSLLEPTVVASDIPCRVFPPGTGSRKVAGGQQMTSGSQIKMPWTAEVLGITPRYLIRIQANGLTPEMIFENPEIHLDSIGPLMIVTATRATQDFYRDTVAEPWQRVVPT